MNRHHGHLHHEDRRADPFSGGDRYHCAVQMIEGFDHLTQAQLSSKGWNANGDGVTAGRFGGQALINKSASVRKALPSTYTTLIVGFAWQEQLVNALNLFDVLSLNVGATMAARVQMGTRGGTNQLLYVANSAGTIIGTGVTPIVGAQWYFIELKIVINGASGSCELRLNGASEIAATTGNFGSTALDSIQLNFVNTSNPWWFDDIYALDTSGAAPRNTFLGDVRVKTVMPDGAGAHSAWTPTGGGAHYTQVNETTPDGDTSYVSDSTPGDIDTYTFADIDGNASVYGVQVNAYARKDDANTRQIAPVIRQAGTDYVGGTVTLGSGYAFFSQLYNQDPTAADWAAATLNGDEFGVKEIA